MIEVKNLIKTFRVGNVETHVLKGVNLRVEDGEFIAIMGRSGAGKSTLLYQMSLLDEPTGGEIIIDGREAHGLSEKERAAFRLNTFGFVFQDYALVPELSALENIVVPMLMQGLDRRQAEQAAARVLQRIAPNVHVKNLPSQISGGEQQRVSIARAVAHKPKILFADEPTANLDRQSSGAVLDVFKELHAQGQTIIMVTHEEEYGKLAERIVWLDDGKIL